jgi:hypothetical protein
MTTECNNCGDAKPDDKFKACQSCREKWRRAKTPISDYLKIHRNVFAYAINELKDMIDGGEECRGRDSQIGHIIGVLENDPWHIHLANQSMRKKA